MTILLGEDKSNKTKLPTEEESRLANSVLAEADFILPKLTISHPNSTESAAFLSKEDSPGVGYSGYVRRTFGDGQGEFRQSQEVWESSDAIRLLKAQLSLVTTTIRLDKVVCLGIGSLQGSLARIRRRSYLQTAAIVTIFECINQSTEVRCIAQDPVYTDLDKDFLSSIGVEAVDHPEAFLNVDKTTLVYGLSGYTFFYNLISRRPWPAALITDGLEWAFEGRLQHVSTFGGRDTIDEGHGLGCQRQPFPQLENSDTFRNTIMYWRGSDGKDAEDQEKA